MSWDYNNRSSLELIFWGLLYCAVPIVMIYGVAVIPGMTFPRFIIGGAVLLAIGPGVLLYMGLQCWRELLKRHFN